MRVVVTGGAGYIGSHVVRALGRAGHQVTVLDDLSNGHAEDVGGAELVRGDVTLAGVLDQVARTARAQAILHFAARIQVGESMAHPARYYATNIGGMLRVVEAAASARAHVVFSSTAAVYGSPETVPIPIDHPCRPENPYGWSKWMSERILADAAGAGGFSYAALRYFNAAGADVEAGLGEKHSPETHLIPLAIDAARSGRPIRIFGDDWPTPDRTCVRDYVHVIDLADAHVRALEHLAQGGESCTFNLGGGRGASVREVLDEVGRAIGKSVPSEIAPRRAGDVAELVADISAARARLGWEPSRSGLAQIVTDAVSVRRAGACPPPHRQ
ncbi:MAG TPA: UDP-glucose 4-epimerase GalE [Polyangia bacterium]